MIRAERFFANCQRAPIEGFGFGVVAHLLVKPRQVVEALSDVGMIWAEVQVPPVAAPLLTPTLFNSIRALPAPEVEPLPTQTRDSATRTWPVFYS
jgi:hypothetical protein